MAQVLNPSKPLVPAEIDPTQRRFRGSAKISDYEIMKEKLGEGTFGIVSKARSKRTGSVFALKKILMHNEKDGFPITALREVKLLKMLSHPNILRLEEMAVERQLADDKGKGGKKRATLYMVTPYQDHDLSGMLTNPDIHFSIAQIKCYMSQLLEGLRYLHDSHILHRDMKAANILISNRGVLQIADFGLARHYEGQSPLPGQGNGEAIRDYTSLVVTRWYRPPELLLTLKRYTPAIDMWGVGCVFGEMFERKPILEGRSDIDQCIRIFNLIGSPNDQTMPGWSELPGCEGRKEWESARGDIDRRFASMGPTGLKLLKQLLCLDWRRRINAIDALRHPYFTEHPLPSRPEELPTYEDSHELDSRRRGHQEKQRALPPAPAGGTVGMGPDEWNGHPNQNGYPYGDRAARGYSRERPSAHAAPPPRGYDDRRGPPPPHDNRQPNWRHQQDRSDRAPRAVPAPPRTGHQLPPRPIDLPARPDVSGRGPPPNGSSRNNVDTYVPSYQAPGGYDNSRPPPRDSRDSRDAYGGRNGARDNGVRESDRGAGRPDPYRERDRGYAPRERSRSPDRERRERLQNRERDLYRR